MILALNSEHIYYVVQELKELLPIRIEKIYIPIKNQLILSVYTNKLKKLLVTEVASQYSRMTLIDKNKRPEQQIVASLQNVFRNLLENGNILDIEQVNQDRIIKITYSNSGNLYFLIMELTGISGNIFILNEENIIISQLLHNKDTSRVLSLNKEYSFPVKKGSFEINIDNSKFGNLKFLNYLENEIENNVAEQIKQTIKNQLIQKEKQTLKKLKQKLIKLNEDKEKLSSYKDYSKYGELLKGNLYLFKNNLNDFIELIDYFNYENEDSKITIKINKEISPLANVNYYFKYYEKYKRGIPLISEYIEKLKVLIEEKELKIAEITESEIDLKANEVKEIKQSKKQEDNTHKPYKIFTNKKGSHIYVGKGSLDNDYLTFKVAIGSDIWLHVVGYPGSHVVIKKQNKKEIIDINTIYQAAHLALLHSKAPKDDKVEVCYTEAKYLKKPKNAKPGQVIFTQEKRVYIQLNEEFIKDLTEIIQ